MSPKNVPKKPRTPGESSDIIFKKDAVLSEAAKSILYMPPPSPVVEELPPACPGGGVSGPHCSVRG